MRSFSAPGGYRGHMPSPVQQFEREITSSLDGETLLNSENTMFDRQFDSAYDFEDEFELGC